MHPHLAYWSGKALPPDEAPPLIKELEWRVPAAPEEGQESSIIEINAKRNAKELEQIALSSLKVLGLDGFGYGRYSRLGESFQIVDFFGHFVQQPWAKRYVGQRYFEIDPRLRFAFKRELPFVWDLDTLRKLCRVERMEQRAEAFLADAEHAGVRSGISFGIADLHCVEQAFISFYSQRPNHDWILDNVVGQTYAVGLQVHELLTRQAQLHPRHGEKIELSDMQRKTLKLVIDGFSRQEIAQHLQTSPQLIDYYILQLQKKFKARNYVQLAYLAGRLRLD
jgi:DNA-binding CsgD family transcriptional regulator